MIRKLCKVLRVSDVSPARDYTTLGLPRKGCLDSKHCLESTKWWGEITALLLLDSLYDTDYWTRLGRIRRMCPQLGTETIIKTFCGKTCSLVCGSREQTTRSNTLVCILGFQNNVKHVLFFCQLYSECIFRKYSECLHLQYLCDFNCREKESKCIHLKIGFVKTWS